MNLIIFELFAALWAISDGFEAAATTLPLKLSWSHISYIGITNSAVMFLIFSLSYTRRTFFINKNLFVLLFIVPGITIIIAFTNSSHHLLWADTLIAQGTNNSIYYYGPFVS